MRMTSLIETKSCTKQEAHLRDQTVMFGEKAWFAVSALIHLIAFLLG